MVNNISSILSHITVVWRDVFGIRAILSIAWSVCANFLPHDVIYSTVQAIVVCLSVSPSVTFVYRIKTAKSYRQTFFLGLVIICFCFLRQSGVTEFQGVPPDQRWRLIHARNVRYFLQIFSQHLARRIWWKWYKISYYEPLAGSRMFSFEPWHFRWPCAALKGHFSTRKALQSKHLDKSVACVASAVKPRWLIINQSITQSVSHSTSQSVSQSINQSINQ